MAATTLLPPFLPLAMINGVSSSVRISSLDWTTFTNPTGAPITRAGLISLACISSYRRTSAVGALPMANMQGRGPGAGVVGT